MTAPLDSVIADLQNRGYGLTSNGERGDGPIIATGGTPPDGGPRKPLRLEVLTDASPLSVVSHLTTAAENGQRPLLCTDERCTQAVQELLESPFLCRPGDGAGGRHFYSTDERVRLADDSFACVRTDDYDSLSWREETTRDDQTGRTGTDSPRLILETDGEVVAALESVDALGCPPPSATTFRHRYARGDDKLIHVFDREGEVGRYPGIGAMKRNAYKPVPFPLVPEHHSGRGDSARLARAWLHAHVHTDGSSAGETEVRYNSPVTAAEADRTA